MHLCSSSQALNVQYCHSIGHSEIFHMKTSMSYLVAGLDKDEASTKLSSRLVIKYLVTFTIWR